MCTPHVRVAQVSYDSLVETLTRGLEKAIAFQNDQNFPAAAGYLLGSVQHALIVLEIQRENCSFEEGYTSPEVQSLSDQAALLNAPIVYSREVNYEHEKELPAEVLAH